MADIKPTRMMPPVYLLGCFLLMVIFHQLLPGIYLWKAPWTYLGALPIVAGFSVFVFCASAFYRHQTTIKPFEESSALLTDGIYRFSRNPIYLSMLVLLGGVAIVLGSLTPWLVLPVFRSIISTRFISSEEAMLAEKFGEEYLQYCKQVRRWV